MSAAVRPEPTFTPFITSLPQRFGESALDVRHELFFLTVGRRPVFIGMRVMAALLSDAWQLCRGPAGAVPPARPLVLVATLAGGNGWGTLGGTAAVILRHDDFDLMSRAALDQVQVQWLRESFTERSAVLADLRCLESAREYEE